MTKKLFNPKYWFLWWGVISSLFISFGMVVTIINATADSHVGYVFLVLEFILPMLFGIYLANSQKFKINFLKISSLFIVLIGTALIFGRLAMLLAPIFVVFFIPILKIQKDELRWAFGSVVLYILSAVPGFAVMVYFNLELYGLALMYITKGMIYGKIMQIIFE